MTEQERYEQIERWATFIIPTVFVGEENLNRKQPEWKERLRNSTKENIQEISDAYCRAIAEEIITNQVNK